MKKIRLLFLLLMGIPMMVSANAQGGQHQKHRINRKK